MFLFSGKSVPCSQSPCFAHLHHLKSRHSHFRIKRSSPGSRVQAGLEIRHPSLSTTFQPSSFSKEITAKSLKEMNMRRSHMGSLRAKSEQLGIKMIPKAYMSTRRYPREREASVGQLETHKDTQERLGARGYRRGKLSTLKSPEEDTKNSKNKKGSSIKQSSQDIIKRGHVMPPWEQLGARNLETGNPRGLIMKDAEEYWWKSGYLEGLKNKLGEDTEKSAFSSEVGTKRAPDVNDLHLFTGKDNRATVGKADVSGYRANNRMPESKTIPEASHIRVSQDTSRGQARTVGINQANSQLGKSSVELGRIRSTGVADKDHTRISQSTNTEQLRTSEDRTRKVYSPEGTGIEPLRTAKAAPLYKSRSQWRASVGTTGQATTKDDQHISKAMGNVGKLDETNMNEWRTLLGTITGETRSTDGQSGSSGGQSGTQEGQSGTSEGQSGTTNDQSGSSENGAVQQENAEISKSSPGKEDVKLSLSKL